MRQKRVLLLTILSTMFLSSALIGCNKNHETKHTNFIKEPNLDCLYQVTYNDYDWANVDKWMNSSHHVNENKAGFGCSSVHNGNFYGRSFDFCYTNMCEFLVRTPRNADRFASIGISIADCNVDEDKVKQINEGTGGEKEKLNEKMIPFAMVDGINENGVVCNTNVVPAKDLIPHQDESEYHTHNTNVGKQNLFYQFMPRFILDNAKSAKHAVELLLNRNITSLNSRGEYCDYLGISHMGYELHCMIADKNDTYIIELVDDRVSVIAGDIMTNFFYTNISPSGSGFERHHTLWDDFAIGASLDGMKRLIHEVKYSSCYDPQWAGADTKCPMWSTEFAGCGVQIFPKSKDKYKLTFYNAESYCTQFWNDPDVDVKGGLARAYENVKEPHYPDARRASTTGPSVPWISTHAEVFDIQNRTLHLVTQEKETADGDYNFQAYPLFQ